MIAMTTGLLAFHAMRLGSNSIRAARTLKARRQQITAKWIGPPTINDPDYSNDESSGEDYGPPGLPDLKPNHEDMGPPDPKQRHEMYEFMIKPWNDSDDNENEPPVYLDFEMPEIVQVNLKVIEERVFVLKQEMPERDDLSLWENLPSRPNQKTPELGFKCPADLELDLRQPDQFTLKLAAEFDFADEERPRQPDLKTDQIDLPDLIHIETPDPKLMHLMEGSLPQKMPDEKTMPDMPTTVLHEE